MQARCALRKYGCFIHVHEDFTVGDNWRSAWRFCYLLLTSSPSGLAWSRDWEPIVSEISGQCSGLSEPKVKQRKACGSCSGWSTPSAAKVSAWPGSVECRNLAPKTMALPSLLLLYSNSAGGEDRRVLLDPSDWLAPARRHPALHASLRSDLRACLWPHPAPQGLTAARSRCQSPHREAGSFLSGCSPRVESSGSGRSSPLPAHSPRACLRRCTLF